MEKDEKILIFLVDDDELYLKLLESGLAENSNYRVKTFLTGELCLDNLSLRPDIIVLDYHLNGIEKAALNGLETLKKIKAQNPHTAVIMLSSQDKIEVAVNCMKLNAFEYIVKSETAIPRLENAIHNLQSRKTMEKTLSWYIDHL